MRRMHGMTFCDRLTQPQCMAKIVGHESQEDISKSWLVSGSVAEECNADYGQPE